MTARIQRPAFTSDIVRSVLAEIGGEWTIEQLQSESRQARLVEGRRRFARALRTRGLMIPRIARLMNRDHSTVLVYLETRKRHSSRTAMNGYAQ